MCRIRELPLKPSAICSSQSLQRVHRSTNHRVVLLEYGPRHPCRGRVPGQVRDKVHEILRLDLAREGEGEGTL